MRIKIITSKATKEFQLDDILDVRSAIKSFCQENSVTCCDFQIVGSAELREVEEDKTGGRLYCLFG